MSVLPIELDFLKNRAASPARMNLAMQYIVARLRGVEALRAEIVTATNALQQVGLARLDETLTPLIADAQASFDQIAALLAAWQSGEQTQALFDQLDATITEATATIDANIVAQNAAVAALLGNVVPATRLISAGAGLTGGGDLLDDLELAVAFATNAEALAGALADKAISPAALKAVTDTISPSWKTIATYTAAANDTYVDFINIPQSYANLLLLFKPVKFTSSGGTLMFAASNAADGSGFGSLTGFASMSNTSVNNYGALTLTGYRNDVLQFDIKNLVALANGSGGSSGIYSSGQYRTDGGIKSIRLGGNGPAFTIGTQIVLQGL